MRAVVEGWRESGSGAEELGARLWYEPPRRIRDETQLGALSICHVSDGRRRWSVFDGDATVEEEKPTLQSPAELAARTIDAALLLPALELEDVVETVHGGRAALCALGTPRESSMTTLHLPKLPGDRVELVVDRERGLLLRLAAWEGGRQILQREVVELELDEELDDAIFSYEGEAEDFDEKERAFDALPRSLEDAVAAMPFQVYVLDDLDASWFVSGVLGYPAGMHPALGPHLNLAYGRWREDSDEDDDLPPARHLHVDQLALPDDAEPAETMRVERGAGKFFVTSFTDPDANARRASILVTLGRTQVQLHSSDFVEDELVELAAKLVPASAGRSWSGP